MLTLTPSVGGWVNSQCRKGVSLRCRLTRGSDSTISQDCAKQLDSNSDAPLQREPIDYTQKEKHP